MFKDFDRIIYRLVYHPESHPGEHAGFNYRDIICDRISKNYCWIVNENLDEIEEWGFMETSIFGKILKYL